MVNMKTIKHHFQPKLSSKKYPLLADLKDQETYNSRINLVTLKKVETSKLNIKQHSDVKRTCVRHTDTMNKDSVRLSLQDQLGRQKKPRNPNSY
jgi:hypothetical protein